MGDAFGKNGQDSNDGTTLDDDVKEVTLPGQPAEILRDEQVAGGGDREELGDTLNKTKDDNGEPFGEIRHDARGKGQL